MIADAILGFIYNVLNNLAALLPTVDTNTTTFFNNSVTTFRSYAGSVNWFFPVSTFMSAIGIILVVELALATYWIIRKVLQLLSANFVHV